MEQGKRPPQDQAAGDAPPAEKRARADGLALVLDAASRDELAMRRLTQLCDRFGHRLSGSESLERSIDWMLEEMRAEGLENVRGEPAMVPSWKRGHEEAVATSLRHGRSQALRMLGLGLSVGTGPGGVEAEMVAVGSFDELDRRAGECRGRVVLFNAPWAGTYSETVVYRTHGASRAAAHGAAAVLVRSVTPYSLATPHTGMLRYAEGAPRVPAACVCVEDAELLQRWCEDGGARVRLVMGCTQGPDVPSRNVVAELRGRELPEEVVVFGGHIDSWDVGSGAHDDGQGCAVAWTALSLLRSLGLRPRRTLRAVCWTNEEMGGSGADAYAAQHADELGRHVAALETDLGAGPTRGFGFSGSPEAKARLERLLRPLAPAPQVNDGGAGVDIRPLIDRGVPGLLLRHEDTWRRSDYFHLHHTEADTVDHVDPRLLRENLAAVAGAVYLLAEWDERL